MLPSGHEYCAFIFENIESLDVVIKELNNTRRLYTDPDYYAEVKALAIAHEKPTTDRASQSEET